MRMRTLADHGAFFSDAQPSKFKIGLMHSTFGCYDVPVAHLAARGLYTNGQGQGHETTSAQIVAHELGIPADDVTVEEGDTDTAPFGMGTYASRSTPVAGAAIAMVCRKVRAEARRLAAHLLEVSEEDIDWELGRFYVRSAPDRGVSMGSASGWARSGCAFATNLQNGIARLDRGESLDTGAPAAAEASGFMLGLQAMRMALRRDFRRFFVPYPCHAGSRLVHHRRCRADRGSPRWACCGSSSTSGPRA